MIDYSSLGLPQTDYLYFKKMCEDIYDFVANNKYANLFRLNQRFSAYKNGYFEIALKALRNNSCLLNGSNGFKIGVPPSFVFSEDINENNLDIDESRYLKRIKYLREAESRTNTLLINDAMYCPTDNIEEIINNMDAGTSKQILNQFLIQGKDFDEITIKYKDAGSCIEKFYQEFEKNTHDVELFEKYDVPLNIFYLFDKTPAYYRLLSSQLYNGYEDMSHIIFPLNKASGDCVPAHHDSNNPTNIPARAINYLNRYLKTFGNTPKMFVSAIIGIFNNTELEKSRVIEIFKHYSNFHISEYPNEYEWNYIFDNYLEYGNSIKLLSYDNIIAIQSIIKIEDIYYGISVDKLYKKFKNELYCHYISNEMELNNFIQKYTPYNVINGRILPGITFEEALLNYSKDIGIYDKDDLLKKYVRRCGGPAEKIKPFLQNIDINNHIDKDFILNEEETALLLDKLSNYEWLSEDNARSIFSDLHNLESKFNTFNMNSLGFKNLKDVYFRNKYTSFKDCLTQNEFVGDDIYVDSREFKIKMENTAFMTTVEYLETYLHWIPVSEYRFINLRSPKYTKFASILSTYKDIISELCKHKFVTPFYLKNIKTNIPEIDDDDYSLEFYDAMLLASRSPHQTIAKHRFYFVQTEYTYYNTRAPDFVKYLVYNNNGKASIDELQSILKTEYGIAASASVIRYQVKLSECIYNSDVDTAYLDREMYMEALRNE